MEQPYNHPAFPQPEDLSIALWRYLDFSKFDWLVNFGRIFMPQANSLGDPFEGTRPEGDLKWMQHEAAKAVSDEQRKIIEHNSALFSRGAREFRNMYFVSCWHMNRHENYAMWKCYTKQTDAVAIRTTYSALREILPDYINIGMVRYIDYTTERLPTFNLLEDIMHKEVYYSFESEVRAVALTPVKGGFGYDHFKENHFKLERQPGSSVLAPPIDIKYLIHGLVIHPQASPEFQLKVRKICAERDLPNPSKSRICRDPIP